MINSDVAINSSDFFYYIDTNTSTWPTPYSQWSFTTTKYLYQIFCPKQRCKGKMWAEIDQVVNCPKCESSIKVVQEQPDYTVAIDD